MDNETKVTPDALVQATGAIYMLRPNPDSPAVMKLINEHAPGNPEWGGAVAITPYQAERIIMALLKEGMTVKGVVLE